MAQTSQKPCVAPLAKRSKVTLRSNMTSGILLSQGILEDLGAWAQTPEYVNPQSLRVKETSKLPPKNQNNSELDPLNLHLKP